MKPFNLELAKQGWPVQTRDGRKVRILCFDANHELHPIVGLVSEKRGEVPSTWGSSGRYFEEESSGDLFMVPVEATVWVNVYRCSDGTLRSFIHPSKEDAVRHITDNCVSSCNPITFIE